MTPITMTFRTLNDSARVTVTRPDKDSCVRAAARALLPIRPRTRDTAIVIRQQHSTVYQITTLATKSGAITAEQVEGSICEC